MPFAALDLHKAEIEAALVDDDGRLTRRLRFPATRQAITAFAHHHLSPEHRVAMEATFNTWAVVDLIRPFVHSVTVGNPLLTRAIAASKIKTDKIDARVLAHLLRLGYLPEVWIPDEPTRQLRRQTTERSCLTADRTRLKNRIHSILNQRLIAAPADLFTPAGLDWLRALPLDAVGRQALDRLLGQLELVERDLAASSLALAPLAWQDPRVRLLMTLPGVGFVVAQALLAALGDLTRFPSPDRAAAYLGLAPSTYQSGHKTYHGRITKRGSAHARWMLVEAAQHLDQHPGPLGVFFRRIARKKNRNVAVVATARKLVTIAWHMLKNNEPYRYALPGPTEEKLRKLRVLATGQRRKTGPPQGQPAVAPLAPGVRSKTVKGLPAVYAAEDLPSLSAPNPGEIRMLDQAGATEFAASVLTNRRVVRNQAPRKVQPRACAS
ncbi:MAG: IS110 family transposase [Bryobacteraceae bacterium]|nr:IS110 family transposase [Bryobacteraceae bacterium]